MIEKAKTYLDKYFGYLEFRKGQQEAIESILNKKDTLVVMPTGSGKSICYQIPGLILDGITLVVSPLISLMKDQVDSLTRNRIKATFINSSLDYSDLFQRVNELKNGIYKFLFVSPERFENKSFKKLLTDLPISLFVVDEAHCISEWGHDFRPSYRKINEAIELLKHPPVIALTATATRIVQNDIIAQLGLVDSFKIVTGFDRPNLSLSVFTNLNKIDKLTDIVQKVNGCGIIYAGTRKNVEMISNHLNNANIQAIPYHAGMDESTRTRVQDNFINDKVRIIVATSAFGMGIDKKNIRFVIHHDLPSSIEQYYQEIGRAGRDGKKSYCILLYNKEDRKLQEFFIFNSHPTKDQIIDIYNLLFDYTRTGIGNQHLEFVPLTSDRVQEINPEFNGILVNSIFNILEQHGYIKQVNANNKFPTIKFLVTIDRLKQYSQISTSKEIKNIVTNLLRYPGNEATFRDFNFDMNKFINLSGATEKDLMKILNILQNSGYLRFTPPIKGKGLFLLKSRINAYKLDINIQKIQKKLFFEIKKLDKMEEYTEVVSCRRNFIVNYFGEEDLIGNCKICDFCIGRVSGDKISIFNDAMKIIILNVLSESDIFGIKTLAYFLAGEKIDSSRRPGIALNKYFGILKHYSKKTITECILHLISDYLIKKKSGKESILILTEKGESFLNKIAKKLPVIPNTLYSTYIMCKDNMGIPEIAEKRELTETTISKHIEELILKGFNINPFNFISKYSYYKIETVLKKKGTENLRTIKDECFEDISYQDIRIARAIYQKDLLKIQK
jgi:ATP-dependent DNA helicase RecQ